MTADPGVSTGAQPVLALPAAAVGLLVVGYGLLLLPVTALGGVWVVGIGLSLALAGLLAVPRFGDRLGLAPSTRRTLVWAFGALAVGLLAAFLLVNGATFEPATASGGG